MLLEETREARFAWFCSSSAEWYNQGSDNHMNTTTIKLYEILVEKGVDRNLAREAVSELVTREEATVTLASKQDITKLVMWTAGLLVAQTATIVAVIALFF